MNKLLFTTVLTTLISSGCGNDNSLKEKELELRERELELKEKEFQSQQEQPNYEAVPSKEQNNTSSSSEKDAIEKLYNKEAKSPKKYLDVNYTYRFTALGNTVIEGKVTNSAMVAGFKNVEITVYFYSKTDLVLGQETFTVMEFVSPNSSVVFKRKVPRWWSNVSYSNCTINDAEAY